MKTTNTYHGKKCAFCGQFFQPDPRVGARQKSCKRPVCQKKRKRAQEKRWKSENPDYFQDLYTEYVKPWRTRHPEYQKRRRDQKRREIKTQFQPESPVKSVRLHLRGLEGFGEIKTQFVRVRQVGQAFWVDGGLMQPERDKNADRHRNRSVACLGP